MRTNRCEPLDANHELTHVRISCEAKAHPSESHANSSRIKTTQQLLIKAMNWFGTRLLVGILSIGVVLSFPESIIKKQSMSVPTIQSPLFSGLAGPTQSYMTGDTTNLSLEDCVLQRYSCKKFRRYKEPNAAVSNLPSASPSDPEVLKKAAHCLNLAQRTPTAFNSQPYKIVMVHKPEQKLALSRYCLWPNDDRVRDSDCTIVFLADRRVVHTLPKLKQLLANMRGQATAQGSEKPDPTKLQHMNWNGLQSVVTLYSSGYPLPRFLAAPLSFLVRTTVGMLNLLMNWVCPMPTLSSAETWASKQAAMVAMTYMLLCSSVGLATMPMEGT